MKIYFIQLYQKTYGNCSGVSQITGENVYKKILDTIGDVEYTLGIDLLCFISVAHTRICFQTKPSTICETHSPGSKKALHKSA